MTHWREDEDVNKTRGLLQGLLIPLHVISLVSLRCSFTTPYWTSVRYSTGRAPVWEWLQFCCDQYKLDANCLCLLSISGLQLCGMTQEEFMEAAGVCGEYLCLRASAHKVSVRARGLKDRGLGIGTK